MLPWIVARSALSKGRTRAGKVSGGRYLKGMTCKRTDSHPWLALVLLGLTTTAAAEQAATPRRPNIVVILADDMGYSDLGCYGGEIADAQPRRARGERRALHAVLQHRPLLPDARVAADRPVPAPGGRRAHDRREPRDLPGYRGELSRRTPSPSPRCSKPAGYATYMTGKWHVTWNDRPNSPQDNWPRQRGFDRFYGTIKGGGSYYDPAMLVRDNTPITPRVATAEYKPREVLLHRRDRRPVGAVHPRAPRQQSATSRSSCTSRSPRRTGRCTRRRRRSRSTRASTTPATSRSARRGSSG